MITLLNERILVPDLRGKRSTRKTLIRRIESSATIGEIMELSIKEGSVYCGEYEVLYRNNQNQFCVNNFIHVDCIKPCGSIGKFLEYVFIWLKNSHDEVMKKFNWDPYNEGEYLVVGYSDIFGGGILSSCDEFNAHRIKKSLLPYYVDIKIMKNSNENLKKIHDELLDFENKKHG